MFAFVKMGTRNGQMDKQAAKRRRCACEAIERKLNIEYLTEKEQSVWETPGKESELGTHICGTIHHAYNLNYALQRHFAFTLINRFSSHCTLMQTWHVQYMCS
jgi:hypothetical protein